MSDLTPREGEAIFRCYTELLKHVDNATAVVERVALIFQVSTRTVYRVLAVKKSGKALVAPVRPGKQRIPEYSDYGFKEALNDFIFMEISKNEPVTVSHVYAYAQECLDFTHSKSTLYRLMKHIGYAYKKVNRRKIIIETPRIISLRIRFCASYLQWLKEAEKGNVKFIYLDETWVFQNGSQIRQWVLESHPKGIPHKFKGEGRRYTIVNAGCDEGFLPGCDLILDSGNNDRDYHKSMDGEIFTKWVTDQLIPALRLLNMKCVVIMDNASYHSMKIEKVPTLSAKKEDLQKWLSDHNVSFSPIFTKKQLYEIIQRRSSVHDTKYKIDELLASEGHHVLRLPPYNCQYNPIELIWGDYKGYYHKHICSKLDFRDRVIEVWSEALQQCSKEKWKNCIKHAEGEIKKDWKKYMGVNNVDDVPPFIINLQSSSSSSSGHESDVETDECQTDLNPPGSDSDEEIIIVMTDDDDDDDE